MPCRIGVEFHFVPSFLLHSRWFTLFDRQARPVCDTWDEIGTFMPSGNEAPLGATVAVCAKLPVSSAVLGRAEGTGNISAHADFEHQALRLR